MYSWPPGLKGLELDSTFLVITLVTPEELIGIWEPLFVCEVELKTPCRGRESEINNPGTAPAHPRHLMLLTPFPSPTSHRPHLPWEEEAQVVPILVHTHSSSQTLR